MQPSQETRVLAEFDGIKFNCDLGLLRMRVVRGNVHTRILHGWGPGIGWGGASAVGTTDFNEADGSGDVSSENEYINVMFWYLFLVNCKRQRNTRAVIHFAITHLLTSDGKPGVGACLHY